MGEVLSSMLCRTLRTWSCQGIFPTLFVCLALVGGLTALPPAWPEDETSSLTPAAHNVPLTAVTESAGVRIEKQAHSHRLILKRPDRSTRLSSAERSPSLRACNPTAQAFHSLPRRQLYAARSRPISPDDPSDPLPS